MPKLETSGTICCGYVSLSDFNTWHEEEADYYDVYEFREYYLLSEPSAYGCTGVYEIDSLMETVNKVFSKGVTMQAILNEDQYILRDKYWPKKLRKHGFQLVRRFDNPTGNICFVYIRVPQSTRLPIKGY